MGSTVLVVLQWCNISHLLWYNGAVKEILHTTHKQGHTRHTCCFYDLDLHPMMTMTHKPDLDIPKNYMHKKSQYVCNEKINWACLGPSTDKCIAVVVV